MGFRVAPSYEWTQLTEAERAERMAASRQRNLDNVREALAHMAESDERVTGHVVVLGYAHDTDSPLFTMSTVNGFTSQSHSMTVDRAAASELVEHLTAWLEEHQ